MTRSVSATVGNLVKKKRRGWASVEMSGKMGRSESIYGGTSTVEGRMDFFRWDEFSPPARG
jgi:hypothetical protein